MDERSARRRAKQLARAALANDDPVGWFDALYAEAAGDRTRIPWADMRVNPWLEQYLRRELPTGPVLVVGSGLGDDAEALAARGYTVTGFDVSPTCIAWCKERFPDSNVEYDVADVLHLPERYRRAFGLVVEIYTVQSLPLELQPNALEQIAATLTKDGTLFVATRGREDDDEPNGPPWPLSRQMLSLLEGAGLKLLRFEDFHDDEDSPKRRFVAVYRR